MTAGSFYTVCFITGYLIYCAYFCSNVVYSPAFFPWNILDLNSSLRPADHEVTAVKYPIMRVQYLILWP